jgi:hypothetical protein
MEQGFTPPIIQPQSIPPIVQNNQPPIKNKISLNKILLGLLLLVIIAGGVGAYVWRDSQANQQKSDNLSKREELEKQLADIETAQIVNQVVHIPTSRGNSTKALSSAQAALYIAEIYAAENNYYPAYASDFETGTVAARLPAGIVPSVSNPTAENGTTTFRWEIMGDIATPTGGRITYWDYVTDQISTNVLYVGEANDKSEFKTPAY